eukprot:15433915-Alexandrium_andersonii.AAC.1
MQALTSPCKRGVRGRDAPATRQPLACPPARTPACRMLACSLPTLTREAPTRARFRFDCHPRALGGRQDQ